MRHPPCYIYIYVWKLNQTVLELYFWAVKFLFFPRRDLNSHHWYTATPIAYSYVQRARPLDHIHSLYIYMRQQLGFFQKIIVRGTSSRITYELWNVTSIRWWYWNITADEMEVDYWKRIYIYIYIYSKLDFWV
jgi:hypothetical protein